MKSVQTKLINQWKHLIYYLFYSSLYIFYILYSTDNRQVYTYDSDDNYYVDSDDYGNVSYYYEDDSDDESIFDWFY